MTVGQNTLCSCNMTGAMETLFHRHGNDYAKWAVGRSRSNGWRQRLRCSRPGVALQICLTYTLWTMTVAGGQYLVTPQELGELVMQPLPGFYIGSGGKTRQLCVDTYRAALKERNILIIPFIYWYNCIHFRFNLKAFSWHEGNFLNVFEDLGLGLPNTKIMFFISQITA